MLTIRRGERVFTLRKRYAMKAFQERNYAEALECSAYACRVRYYGNVKFSDVELEALITQISGLPIGREPFTLQCGKLKSCGGGSGPSVSSPMRPA